MKIYDISQEVFGCEVYPGDPAPEKKVLNSMEEGDSYNLSAFSMCAHNGTHIDAPFHFIRDGKTVDSIDLDAFVGMAYVAEHQGIVSGDDAAQILKKAKEQDPNAAKRILIKGNAEVSPEAAKYMPNPADDPNSEDARLQRVGIEPQKTYRDDYDPEIFNDRYHPQN